MDENPWRLLPAVPPYVLAEDEPLIREFNAGLDANHDCVVQIGGIMPEAFVGARDAPVVLLSNNPGFGKGAPDRRRQEFAEMMRRNLHHEFSDYPFALEAIVTAIKTAEAKRQNPQTEE